MLIKRQLVAMVTWILANKRLGEKCLLGDGKKRGKQRKQGRQRDDGTAELNRDPGQCSQAEHVHVIFLPASKKRLR